MAGCGLTRDGRADSFSLAAMSGPALGAMVPPVPTHGTARPPLQRDTPRGLGLALIGGISLSFDIPLIRLAGSDPWMVMLLRGGGMAIVLWLYWRFISQRRFMPVHLLSDRDFITVGALSGLNNICFTLAVFNTSTANVVFILAFSSMAAALMSWALVGERPGAATWWAIAATIVGVALIVAGSLDGGNWVGDLLALVCAILIALSITLARRSGKDLSMAPGFGGVVSALFALPTVLVFSAMPAAPHWILIDAFILVPLAGITLWLAPRFIPAPHVALFYLLETVLAPIWVWLVFAETPSRNVFIGGAIVLGAIFLHTLFELRRRQA